VASDFVVSAFLAAGLFLVLPSYFGSITLEVQTMLFGGMAMLAALVSDGQLGSAALVARMRGGLERAAVASQERRRCSPVNRSEA